MLTFQCQAHIWNNSVSGPFLSLLTWKGVTRLMYIKPYQHIAPLIEFDWQVPVWLYPLKSMRNTCIYITMTTNIINWQQPLSLTCHGGRFDNDGLGQLDLVAQATSGAKSVMWSFSFWRTELETNICNFSYCFKNQFYPLLPFLLSHYSLSLPSPSITPSLSLSPVQYDYH